MGSAVRELDARLGDIISYLKSNYRALHGISPHGLTHLRKHRCAQRFFLHFAIRAAILVHKAWPWCAVCCTAYSNLDRTLSGSAQFQSHIRGPDLVWAFNPSPWTSVANRAIRFKRLLCTPRVCLFLFECGLWLIRHVNP